MDGYKQDVKSELIGAIGAVIFAFVMGLAFVWATAFALSAVLP